MVTKDRDYVLGTHDEELQRLGLQHRVWRPRALDAWRRAGIREGSHVIDLGCGPGYASLDLAEIVGPTGRVLAVDRSERFLTALATTASERGLTQVSTLEVDLSVGAPPQDVADHLWARWIFCFLPDARAALAAAVASVRRGGSIVLHEYLDYSTWRVTPHSAAFESFVAGVMASWRADGGEPNVALDLVRYLNELGCDVREVRPIIDVVAPDNFVWRWPATFVDVNLKRLVQLGRLDEATAQRTRADFAQIEATPGARMSTPAVLEVLAIRRT